MIWFYRLLYLPGLLLALPYYTLRMWRRGGYRKDFQHRFGRFRRLRPPSAGKQRIWLQAVSVGEIFAIGPLIEALQQDDTVEIVLTTTTSTGYAEARKRYADTVLSIGIFPLDFWLFSRTAWKRIQPDAIILTESELWPEHLHQASKRKIPAFLVNARISDRSFQRYQKVPQLAGRLLRKLDAIFAASALDQTRLVELGASQAKVVTHGSIKFDTSIQPNLSDAEKKELRAELGFAAAETTPPHVLLGASTWPGEESALLCIQGKLIENGMDCRLLLVPRHAERGGELTKELAQHSPSWHRRSTQKKPTSPVRTLLADTTGELTRLSQVADLAFIGKSMPPNQGGQTPIEAAGLGIPILMGPNMGNFREVAASLVRSGAARTVKDAQELEAAITQLLSDPEARKKMSEAGRAWHARNRGSSQRIADAILKALSLR